MIHTWYGAVLSLILFIAGSFPVYGVTTTPSWEAANRGISEADMHHLIGTDRGNVLYAASRSILYRTEDSGNRWHQTSSPVSAGSQINALAAAPGDGSTVYVASDRGLSMTGDSGVTWVNIFTVVGETGSAVLSVAVMPDDPATLLIGTADGLYISASQGRTWEKSRFIPSDAPVLDLASHPAHPSLLYALTVRGLYKSTNRGGRWERVLPLGAVNEEGSSDDNDGVPEEDRAEEKPVEGCLALDPHAPHVIYAGISGAVHVSRDSGSTWNLLSTAGLGRADIRRIMPDTANTGFLHAATSRGVFSYSPSSGAWQEIYLGMDTSDVRSLAFARPGHDSAPALWAATARGLYRMVPPPSLAALSSGKKPWGTLSPDEAFSPFAHEPTIAEIREAAIEYAEVQPRKISAWRKAAARRALLPDLNFRYGKGEDWQSSTYFYSTKDEKYKDDDVTRGDDESWSVSITWELGDLIWNNDQTSIDSRSRLLVQLRDDVLSEVTRLYFERRRLQMDLLVHPPASAAERIEKDLRLMELTAGIDAMTGSYLSARLEQSGPADLSLSEALPRR